MAKELDADMVDDSLARAAAKLAMKPAVDNGAEELFEKKCANAYTYTLLVIAAGHSMSRDAAESDAGWIDSPPQVVKRGEEGAGRKKEGRT